MAEDRLKPKSYRIDDETAEKIRLITNELGGNQQETLSKMIEAYEFQKGKVILTDKREEVESFEKYVTILSRMFMASVEENQNVKALVRSEYEAQLRSKDLMIQELQDKGEELKGEKNKAVNHAGICNELNGRLEEKLKAEQDEARNKIKQLETMLQDKEGLNKVLTSSCEEHRRKVEDMQTDIERSKEVRAQFAKATAENATLQREVERLLVEVASKDKVIESVKAEMQIACEKRVLEMEREHQKALQALDEGKRAEIDKYQKNYLSLLEQMKQGASSHSEE